MNYNLRQSFERDRHIWNACAAKYEEHIVGGHPDITAYESFEEDLLDQILRHLATVSYRNLSLYDVGCGSGRLHLRYGMKISDSSSLSLEDAGKVDSLRRLQSNFKFDSLLSSKLQSIGGIDFSQQMLKLAREKLRACGLGAHIGEKLWFEEGSAFNLKPMKSGTVPVVVCLCNSIGVMQGPLGAIKLFQAMRRAVEQAGGIAIISAYRKDAISSYGLNNYESTMDVSGQPRWLIPDTYASIRYKQVPQQYKRAYDSSPVIKVDVFTRDGKLVKKDHELHRDEDLVRKVIETGEIHTYHDYNSHWYSYEQFSQWIETHLPQDKSYHIYGDTLDDSRAEPVQIAIFDASGKLQPKNHDQKTNV